MKTWNSRVGKLESAVWNMHLTVPKDVAVHFIKSGGKRVICNIDGRHEFHAALMSKGGGEYFININKEIRKKLSLEAGDQVPITLMADKSKYGIWLAPEMEELLIQDVDGNALFHQLTPGKQRSLLHIIGKPKSSDIRLRKGLMVLDYLKSSRGQLDFKALHQFFKEFKGNYT